MYWGSLGELVILLILLFGIGFFLLGQVAYRLFIGLTILIVVWISVGFLIGYGIHLFNLLLN